MVIKMPVFIHQIYKQEKTWHEALSFCKAIGGDLMSIHSSADLELDSYVFSIIYLWIIVLNVFIEVNSASSQCVLCCQKVWSV